MPVHLFLSSIAKLQQILQINLLLLFVNAVALDKNPADEKAKQPLSPIDQIQLLCGKDFLQFITFYCFLSLSLHIFFSIFPQLLFPLHSASILHIMQFQHDPAQVISLPEAIYKA